MRNQVSRISFLAFMFAGLSWMHMAGSPILSFTFNATIESMFEHDGGTQTNTFVGESSLAGPSIANGQSLLGSFSFDMGAGPSPYDDSTDQIQVYLPIQGHLSFAIPGTYSVGLVDPVSVAIANNLFGTSDSFFLTDSILENGIFRSAYVSLVDLSGSVYSGYSLPSGLALADFDSATFHFAYLCQSDGDQLHFDAKITFLNQNPASVPDDSGSVVVLTISSALFMGWVRRRAR